MTKPNLFFIDGVGYSIHTYAKDNGISVGVASKRLHRMARMGLCKFFRRNSTNWKIVGTEFWNNWMIEFRKMLLEFLEEK